ncbi:MAG: hypothetical protein ABF260_05825 [Flavobacteriaceae bacterium]
MMTIQKNDQYTLVSVDESTFNDFENQLTTLKTNHLVLELSDKVNTDTQKIALFLNIVSDFKTNGMSFVVIKSGINIDDFPESLNIVPTLQEAEDILEMEAIERDLGF